ncbi:MAG: ABC transporter ATP-binding protein [Nanoarchaeota archaeon]
MKNKILRIKKSLYVLHTKVRSLFGLLDAQDANSMLKHGVFAMHLDIKKVSKNFGGIVALDKCSLEIKEGKIIAIIGPNGSGKSTLFNVISNIVSAGKGKIYFSKEDITGREEHEIAKIGISRTFQEVRLFKNLTIEEHLKVALSDSDYKLIKSFFYRQPNEDDRIKEILEMVGLKKPVSTLSSELSYGQKKLLGLAVAIAKPHSILMLDEPVAGINPELRKEIFRIIKELNNKGESIAIIEHDMNFVMNLAHYIYVLDSGRLIAEGTPREVQKNKRVLEAYLGK